MYPPLSPTLYLTETLTHCLVSECSQVPVGLFLQHLSDLAVHGEV